MYIKSTILILTNFDQFLSFQSSSGDDLCTAPICAHPIISKFGFGYQYRQSLPFREKQLRKGAVPVYDLQTGATGSYPLDHAFT